MNILLGFTAFLFFISATNAGAATLEILTPNIKAGETIVVKFDEEPKGVALDGKTITAFPYQKGWRAIKPMPLASKTGKYKIAVEWKNGQASERTIYVSKKEQKLLVFPPPPKLGLTDKEITKNLGTSNVSIRNTVQEVKNNTYFSETFGLPLADNRKISSPFGEIRRTGGESITHLGLDLAAAKGRAVAAINAGVIKDAYTDPIYGKSVIIDHGRGIYSLYMHLNSIKVSKGNAVKRGALIGTVGETGLASAPHLHLSIKVGGVSVDPAQFVSAFR